MKFITVRELKHGSKKLWKNLKKDIFILTRNGKPVAFITPVDEENFEEKLQLLRRLQAMENLKKLREKAREYGLDKIGEEEIEEEVRKVRGRKD